MQKNILKSVFFPTNRTIFSYKLDTKIDCHLFPIIEKMVSIGIKCIDHCHGNHIFKFSESYELDYDLIVKSAYIQFEYLNSENENSLVKYAQKKICLLISYIILIILKIKKL